MAGDFVSSITARLALDLAVADSDGARGSCQAMDIPKLEGVVETSSGRW